jgi:hypothetical protein
MWFVIVLDICLISNKGKAKKRQIANALNMRPANLEENPKNKSNSDMLVDAEIEGVEEEEEEEAAVLEKKTMMMNN